MATVTTKGKVKTYDSTTGKLVCERSGIHIWRGNKVRTSGSNDSLCNTSTFIFDVTVSSATAAQLVPGFVFELEYDDSVSGPVKPVTKFAGQAIPPGASAFSADLSASAGLPLPGLPARNSPSSLPPAP